MFPCHKLLLFKFSMIHVQILNPRILWLFFKFKIVEAISKLIKCDNSHLSGKVVSSVCVFKPFPISFAQNLPLPKICRPQNLSLPKIRRSPKFVASETKFCGSQNLPPQTAVYLTCIKIRPWSCQSTCKSHRKLLDCK